MGFSPRISSLTLLDKVKSADIGESLSIESLLLYLERAQLRWYGHVTQYPWKEQQKNCRLQHPLIEGLEAVPACSGEITLKILVGLVLASQQSIYPLLRRIEMLGGSNSAPTTPLRLS